MFNLNHFIMKNVWVMNKENVNIFCFYGYLEIKVFFNMFFNYFIWNFKTANSQHKKI